MWVVRTPGIWSPTQLRTPIPDLLQIPTSRRCPQSLRRKLFYCFIIIFVVTSGRNKNFRNSVNNVVSISRCACIIGYGMVCVCVCMKNFRFLRTAPKEFYLRKLFLMVPHLSLFARTRPSGSDKKRQSNSVEHWPSINSLVAHMAWIR